MQTEVYDDSTGKRLTGVQVTIRGADEEQTLVIDGQMSQSLEPADYELQFDKSGYSRAYRPLTVVGNEARSAFDVRLTPLADPVSLTIDTAAEITVNEAEAIRVSYAAESVPATGQISVTQLSGQGLPNRLPGGWSPQLVLAMNSDVSGLGTPTIYPGRELPASTIAVVYEPDTAQWRRIAVDVQGLQYQIQNKISGTIALIVPDSTPTAPPVPEAGEVLTGLETGPVESTAQLQILPSPKIILINPDAQSKVSANADGLYSSGRTFELEISEVYELKDGTRRLPPGSVQDFVLYQQGDSSLSRLVVSPNTNVDGFTLDVGTIYLSAYSEKSEGAALVAGTDSQSIVSENITLRLPAGSSASPYAASVTSQKASQFFSVGPNAAFVQGIDIDLSDAQLPKSAELSVQLGDAASGEHRYVFVRPVTLADRDYYEYIGRGVVQDGSVSLDVENLPTGGGIYSSSRVVLLSFDNLLSYVTGDATAAEVAEPEIIVGTNQSRVISRVNSDGSYELAVPLGDNRLFAIELTEGHEDAAEIKASQAGESLSQDFNLSKRPPSIMLRQPADQSEHVNLLQPITVLFSQVMNPASVSQDTLQVSANGEPVSGTVSLSSDQRTLVFNRNVPWDGETDYTVTLNNTITNQFDVTPVSGAQWSFKTATSADAPPLTQAGINSEYIAVDQLQITGGAGTVAPGSLVTATVNGVTTTVVANNDGSFSMIVTAKPTDDVQLQVPSLNGGESQQLGLEVPLVVTGIVADQGLVVMSEVGATAQLSYSLTYSRPNSENEIAEETISYHSLDSSIVSISDSGQATAVAEGETRLIVRTTDGFYSSESFVEARVLDSGELILSETVSPSEGLYFDEGGLIIEIPPGAVQSDIDITVRKVMNPGSQIELNSKFYEVENIYRFEPSIEFDETVLLTFPINQSENKQRFLVSTDSSDLSKSTLDGLAFPRTIFGHDHASGVPTQYVRGNRLIVPTNHFSSKSIVALGGGDYTSDQQTRPVLEENSTNRPFTPRIDVVGSVTGTYGFSQRTNSQEIRYIVHHGTNFPANIQTSIDIPAKQTVQAENGQTNVYKKYRVKVCGNNLYRDRVTTMFKPKISGVYRTRSIVEYSNNTNGTKKKNTTTFTLSATEISFGIFRVTDGSSVGGVNDDSSIFDYVPSEDSVHCQTNVPAGEHQTVVNIPLAQEGETLVYGAIFEPNHLRRVLSGESQTISKTVGEGNEQVEYAITLSGPFGAFEENRQLEGNYVLQSNPASAPYAIGPSGNIYQIYGDDIRVAHAGNASGSSIGIELMTTGHSWDFYTGEQIDSLISLTDHLVEKHYESVSDSAVRIGLRNRTEVNNTLFRDSSGQVAGFNRLNTKLFDENDNNSLNDPLIGRDRAIVSTPSGQPRLSDQKIFVTHSESDRDEVNSWEIQAGVRDGYTFSATENSHRYRTSGGSRWRKADPSGPTYNVEAVEAALHQDFPGLVNTSGGDILVIGTGCIGCGAKGGNVTVRYGESENSLQDTLFNSDITPLNTGVLESLKIASDKTLKCSQLGSEYRRVAGTNDYLFANLIIDGTINIDVADCKLRVAGTMFLSPTGSIVGVGTQASPAGRNLEISGLGPVVLHGAINLSGFPKSSSDGPENGGGNLVVRSRARSPLQVPTIITRGGDLGYIDDSVKLSDQGEGFGKGGRGGDVRIVGSPGSSIIFSGFKIRPDQDGKIKAGSISCDYENKFLTDNKDSRFGGVAAIGALYPLNRVPSDDNFSFSNDASSTDGSCGVTDLNTRAGSGLSPTHGRGIVTSGGLGASVQTISSTLSIDEESKLKAGAGGDGGDIHISFQNDQEGIVRFRDVVFMTGAGAGFLKANISVALTWVRDDIPANPGIASESIRILPFIFETGGAGGKGYGVRGTFGLAALGGDGGKGGKAGDIYISPSVSSPDFPGAGSSDVDECEPVSVLGHDARNIDGEVANDQTLDPSLPKDVPIETIGRRVKFYNGECLVEDSPGLTLILDTEPSDESSMSFTNVSHLDQKREVPNDACFFDKKCLLGGSGGLAGGSTRGGIQNSQSEFSIEGTSGRFGSKGEPGLLTLPVEWFDYLKFKD